ncbi:MAG: hypothetical protein JNJ90_06185 [Saprospiraceae bacterium]|nr:hypothetical protein [Saprospiraceae bacterium]
MSRKHLFPLFLLLFTVLFSYQCSKDSNPLAEPTFFCKIDGRPFSRVISMSAELDSDGALVFVAVGEKDFESIILYIPNFTGKGVYPLEANVPVQQNNLIYHASPDSPDIYSNFSVDPGAGVLQVTNYEGGGVLFATFSGHVNIDGDTAETLHITEGRIENVQVVPK